MKLKLKVFVFMMTLLSGIDAYSKVIKYDNKIISSNTNSIALNCNITDSGVGMSEGSVKFRYVDTVTKISGEWTDSIPYMSDVEVKFVQDLPSINPLKIEALFCDSLGNCQTEEETVFTETFIIDNKSPVGTISIHIDVVIDIKQN